MAAKSLRSLEARERIVDFHNRYVRHVEARQAGNVEQSHRILMEMADRSLAVQRDLDQVNQGMIILKDMPALGGRQYGTRLVDVVLTDLADQYNIEPDMIQVMLRQAAGEYEELANQPGSPAGEILEVVLRGLGFVILVPIRVVAAALLLIRRHYVAAAVLLGATASLATVLQFLGRLL